MFKPGNESMANFVEKHPDEIGALFNHVEQACNFVFPTHGLREDRYRTAAGIPLAMIIGLPNSPSFNPFDETKPALLFHGSNQFSRPEAWVAKPEVDAELLGGTPEEMGRFTAYALAKAENLRRAAKRNHNVPGSSYRGKAKVAEKGVVGLAGGVERFGVIGAISGLYHPDDHMVSLLSLYEIRVMQMQEREPAGPIDIADVLIATIEKVRRLYEKAMDRPGKKEENSLRNLLRAINYTVPQILSLRHLQDEE